MVKNRVVVSGLGVVTPLGNDLESTLRSLHRGESGIGPVTLFDAEGWDHFQAAEVKNFQARPFFRVPKALKLTDRKIQFAVAAAAMALVDASLTDEKIDFENVGTIVGTGDSDLQPREITRAIRFDPDLKSVTDIAFFSSRVLSGLPPLWLLTNLPNMVGAHIAIQFQLHGPNNTLMTDWISGTQAVGEAFRIIQEGDAQIMLASGAESGVRPQAFLSYAQAGLMSEKIKGQRFVIGEGAGFLVLEERRHALERRARIYAEVCGYACGCAPLYEQNGGGLAPTMTEAMKEATWKEGQLDVVHCASICSRRHRRVESAALRHVFGRPLHLRLESFKSQIGHTLSASGPIEAALSIRSSLENRAFRILCNNLGLLGQAATVAFLVKRENHAQDGN